MKKAARIIGLIIVTLIAGIYLFIIVGGLFERESLSMDIESLSMAILSIFTIASAVLAWIKMRLGVWFVLTAGVLFTVFALLTAGQNQLMAVMAAGGPLLIGGLLMLLGVEKSST
ncbi:MAG: hypothetical protein ACK2TV_08980 [Anaerolineales bacterium]|jgi:hypothetical protein